MVRRTRTEIEKYFPNDITIQGLKFPNVEKPVPLFYELNETDLILHVSFYIKKVYNQDSLIIPQAKLYISFQNPLTINQ